MPDSRAVLITGASKGIGRATALHLDRKGFTVFAGVRRDSDADALRATTSGRVRPIMLDVTDQASIDSARAEVAEQTDWLVGLVNNAGIVVAGPLEALPVDELRAQFEVNVFGVVAVTQALLPLIRRSRGRIVNVSSVNGRVVTPFVTPYSASKFALEGISDGLRLELRPWRIPVSVIQPGAIESAIWETSTSRLLENSRSFDNQMLDRYGRVVEAVQRRGGAAPRRALPPDRVAAVIHKALTARRPRTRYIVGNDARLGVAFAALLPDRLKDYILAGRHRRRL